MKSQCIILRKLINSGSKAEIVISETKQKKSWVLQKSLIPKKKKIIWGSLFKCQIFNKLDYSFALVIFFKMQTFFCFVFDIPNLFQAFLMILF